MGDAAKRDALDRWLEDDLLAKATGESHPVVEGSGERSAIEVVGINEVWLLDQAKDVLYEAMALEDGAGLATARATVELLMRVTGMLDARSTVEH